MAGRTPSRRGRRSSSWSEARPPTRRSSGSHRSIAESIAELPEELARIVPVEAIERQTIVDQQVAVCCIQHAERSAETLAECLANAHVQARVTWKVAGARPTVREARAVVEIRRRKRLPW